MSHDIKALGPYRVLERIGTGGMATVYRVEMKTADGVRKIAALKILHPHLAEEESFVQMFLNECRLAAELRHENIVSPFDFGEIAGAYYMAMDYHRGMNLRTILERLARQNLTLSLQSGLLILCEVLQGLRYAHRFTDGEGRVREVIHRDVSPQNILVTTDGDVRLIDFGIAKIMGETGMTDIGTIKGKIQYMSPEQAAGRSLDRRSDLYSLAAVAHEIFTGDMLFPERDPTRVLRQIQIGEFRLSEEFDVLPPRLQKVIRRALHRSPSRRYEDAKSYRHDLLQVARRDARPWDPRATRMELGMLVRAMVDGGADADGADIRLPTALLEPEEGEVAASAPRSGTEERVERSWSRAFAYACVGLIVIALLLEVMGIDLRPTASAGGGEGAPRVEVVTGQAAPR